MLQLPLDCILNIINFLEDSDIINLTHTNNFLHSLQELITLTNTPVYPDTKLKFQFTQNYWFPSYPNPQAKHVIIKAPDHLNISSDYEVILPENFNSITSLTIEHNLKHPLPTFNNLTTLKLNNIPDFNIDLPETLEVFHVRHNHSNFINLSHLVNLTKVDISENNISINLDDHPKLESIYLFGINSNIKISKDHLNIKTIVCFSYYGNVEYTPNLTMLTTIHAVGDINMLDKLEHFHANDVVGPTPNLGNFKNLNYFVMFDDECIIPGNGHKKITKLTLSNIRLVTDELFPKLEDLTITAGRGNLETNDEIVIDHCRLRVLKICCAKNVTFANAFSLKVLDIFGNDYECLVRNGCTFANLEVLNLGSRDGDGIFVIDMSKMWKLKKICCPRNGVKLLGESNELKMINVRRIIGDQSDVMKRFKNMRGRIGSWG